MGSYSLNLWDDQPELVEKIEMGKNFGERDKIMEKKLFLICLSLILLVNPAFSATMPNPYTEYAKPVIITLYDGNGDNKISLAITNLTSSLYYSFNNDEWYNITNNITLEINQKQDVYFKLDNDNDADLTFQGIKNNGYSTVIIQWDPNYFQQISIITSDNDDYLGPKINSSSPPVPLPGSAVLLGSGLLGLALVWRRQQRRR